MPAAPKEKAASTAREKGKGKEKDQDGGGKEKEPKQRKKPGRVPTSCAECRRLKLRCDRNVPCTKCVSRGCGSICPDGTLAPGKGNRLVLANTEELHARIDVMADRNRALEKALADLHNQSREGQGGAVHPLLAEGRLELGDLGRLSVVGGNGGLGSTSESRRSSLMVPTPSPRGSTSASGSTNSPTSQSHSHPRSHSQSRSPVPERQAQALASASQPPQRWREAPPPKHLQRSDGDENMELDLDQDDGHDKDSDELENEDVDDERLLHDLDTKGTLFVGDGEFSPSQAGGGGSRARGGGRSTYYYLGRSARPEFLAQIIPSASIPVNFSSLAQIRAILPERDVALNLCDVYLAYGTSVYTSVMARAQLEQIMRGVYRAMEHSASAPGSLLSDMAFLLAAFALGALFSPAFAPYSEEARNYYAASQAVLDMLPHDANEMVVHALLHLTHFAELISTAASTPSSSSTALRRTTTDTSKMESYDTAWAHTGRGVRIAQRMGMYISPLRWPGISEDDRTRRDSLWWGLFVADTWTSFNLGRPPAISRSYVDCAVPQNRTLPSHIDLVTSDSDSIFHSWYLHFTLLLHDALDTIVVGPKPTTSAYATVLEHDRRIRNFYVPRAWRMSSSASASTGRAHSTRAHDQERDDGFVEDDEDLDEIEEDMEPQDPHYRSADSGSGRKKDEEEMYRWLVMSAKEIVLLRLHQPYFVQAFKACDPTASGDEALGQTPYLPSVLAVFRSMRRLSSGLARTWAMIPKFLARVGAAWSHGLSAAVAAALVVTRAPDSDLASGALDELVALVSVFGAAVPVCPPAANMMNLVRDLHQTAAQARSRRYRSSDTRSNNISPGELERLNGQTTFLHCPPPSGSHHSHPFEPPSSSLILPPQHQYQPKPYDYERHEPRPRSRATSATMSDFATDTHYNQPSTLINPHNAHYTHQPSHERQGLGVHKLSHLMEKLHPILARDVRLFEEQGSLSDTGVTFHDSPSDAATVQKEQTPQRPKIAGTTPSFSPHAVASTMSLPHSAYDSQQGSSYPIYRNPTPPPNQSRHRSYPQPSLSEDHYHSQRTSPNPPRLIVDPYMSPKPHAASTTSSMQYLDDNLQRGQAYSGSHSYPQTQAHIPQQANYHAPPSMYHRPQREQQNYQYADIDDEDLSNTITSGFYASGSRMRSGVGNAGTHSSIGGSINLNDAPSTTSSVTNISTTTTTTATMSTSTSGGFMPHPFVVGPLPNGFQSGFFPGGFSSGYFPSPIVLDPSWNSFVEQLGFCS